MSRIENVLDSTRMDDKDEGAQCVEVKADAIDTVQLPQFSAPGDDSRPLPGDKALIDEDAEAIVGYADIKSAGAALPGEKRIYARSEDGTVVGHVYLRRDGTIELELDANGFVAIAGLVDARLSILRSDLTTLKAAIGAGFTAVGVGGAANGPAGKSAFDSAATALPSALDSVASETVMVRQP